VSVKCHVYYRQLVSGERQKFADISLLAVLKLCAGLYAAIMRLRALAYKYRIIQVKRLPLPVISVGNITIGGTGKTPAVLLIARELIARGKRVAVLTRGYGGSLEGETRIVSDGKSLLLTPAEAGDEPCLLAASLPGLMVVMGSDRYRGGCLAIKERSPDCFILDDGFQHQRLHRDLDIILLDAALPFGNGWTLPAGFLREPPSAACRADFVILTRSNDVAIEVAGLPEQIPLCRSSHTLTGYTLLSGVELHPFRKLQEKRIVAFCGIADPEAFFKSLESSGVQLVATLAFPDHSKYGAREMEALGRLKQQSRADCLLTTAKDAVKLTPFSGIIGDCLVAQLELTLYDAEPLNAALNKLFQAGGIHGAIP
jgi:tetraacyldisaccharide 4'-kinase